MVVKKLLPLSFTESPEFVDVIKDANFKLKVPKRDRLTTKMLPEMLEEVNEKIKVEISKTKYVAITTGKKLSQFCINRSSSLNLQGS